MDGTRELETGIDPGSRELRGVGAMYVQHIVFATARYLVSDTPGRYLATQEKGIDRGLRGRVRVRVRVSLNPKVKARKAAEGFGLRLGLGKPLKG